MNNRSLLFISYVRPENIMRFRVFSGHFLIPIFKMKEKINDVIVGFGQKIEGIGISCPGPLDLINGIILETPNLPGWNYFHLTEALQQITGIKVQLQNDANLAGLAEAVIGAGAGKSHVQFLTI